LPLYTHDTNTLYKDIRSIIDSFKRNLRQILA